ncbi:uncharacterized protein LOC141905878 [Tubulanus polymorphus]|uniref:uncharacterized protein LOC141905878 n=1 Tax=Tubulanus polymorphus TaxID=672921 RepID=UPI003DA669F4
MSLVRGIVVLAVLSALCYEGTQGLDCMENVCKNVPDCPQPKTIQCTTSCLKYYFGFNGKEAYIQKCAGASAAAAGHCSAMNKGEQANVGDIADIETLASAGKNQITGSMKICCDDKKMCNSGRSVGFSVGALVVGVTVVFLNYIK